MRFKAGVPAREISRNSNNHGVGTSIHAGPITERGDCMTSIATLGPKGSHAWQAALQFKADAEISLYPQISKVIEAFVRREIDLAAVPVYNTREGEIKEYFHMMENLSRGYWIDNVVLPIHLSLGAPAGHDEIRSIIGTATVLRQCEAYIGERFPNIPMIVVQDLSEHLETHDNSDNYGVIDSEEALKEFGLDIIEREVAPHNRTRFAVLGHTMAASTGYDATAILTAPLMDRVGLLFDILGEFTKRGVNLLDMRTETDIKSQKLQFYFEVEGHIQDTQVGRALKRIESHVIQEPRSMRVLGSFPRVDMRVKHIKNFGFIGTGDLSAWFAKKLENEGYTTLLSGRSSRLRPEDMIPQVDVVVICVPISATPATIELYGPLLRDGQALILLAGEAENTVNTALAHTKQGVEVILVHNLWGPQTTNMKDKNASVVRTARTGSLCSEFESFLYKHGAVISQDAPRQHDLLMGVGQKLPTAISIAMAMSMQENNITPADIGTHSTLTSLYGILAMARVHSQNPRTYAEIMAAHGAGNKVVRDFVKHLRTILDHADAGDIPTLCSIIEQGRGYLSENFLEARMEQALAVDETLGKLILP